MRALEELTSRYNLEPLTQEQIYNLVYGYVRNNADTQGELYTALFRSPNVISSGTEENPSFLLQDPHVRHVLGDAVRQIAKEREHDARYVVARTFDGWLEELTIARQTPSGKRGITVQFEMRPDRTALPTRIRLFTKQPAMETATDQTATGGKIISLATFASGRRIQRG